MSTSAPHPPSSPDPSADRSVDRADDLVGDGRYRLGRALSPVGNGGLRQAEDTRLGRGVLVRCEQHSSRAPQVTRHGAPPHLAVAPVLDAGEEPTGDGGWRSYTVFPAIDWLPFDALPTRDLAVVGTAGIATAAAWLAAATVHQQTAGDTTVALSSDAVVIDLRWLAGALAPDECPVRWMPARDTVDDLVAVVDRLGTHVRRRDRRRWALAVAPLAVPHGRRRAVRLLAALAGLDPQLLGLTPLAPHHAGRGRRSPDRRPPVGSLPTSTRKELPCESVEACS